MDAAHSQINFNIHTWKSTDINSLYWKPFSILEIDELYFFRDKSILIMSIEILDTYKSLH